jgi:hypothetical protein
MKQIVSKLFLTTFILVIALNTFGQRGYDYDDSEEYNWNEFNAEEFFIAALIFAVVIVVGLLIRKESSNIFIKGIGITKVVLGSLGAFIFLGGPILGAITIIWQVVVGAAIFFGIIYWAYNEFIDTK